MGTVAFYVIQPELRQRIKIKFKKRFGWNYK